MNREIERWLFFAEEDLRGAEVMFQAALYNLVFRQA